MDDHDVAALQKCLAQYRRLSTLHRNEVVELEARHRWKRAAFQACIRLQAFDLDLGDFELTPAELEPNSPRLVEGSPNDRGKQIAILKQLLELGLSRYVPNPRQAIQKELHRRKALANRGDSPPRDAAYYWRRHYLMRTTARVMHLDALGTPAQRQQETLVA